MGKRAFQGLDPRTNDRATVARAAAPMGQAIKAARTGKRLTQEEAAQRCGLNPRYFQKLEAGEMWNPTLLTLMRVAAGLDVAVADLLRDLGALGRGASGGGASNTTCNGSFQLVFKNTKPPVRCTRCGALVGVRTVEGGKVAVAFHPPASTPAPPSGAVGAIAGKGAARPRSRGPGGAGPAT